MIGALTKKITARVFTLWFHCGLFPLHGSMVSAYHNVLISVLSSPLPTHFHNHRPQRHLLSDLWPCVYAQHVECFFHVKKNKLGWKPNSTLSSQAVWGRRQNSLKLVFLPLWPASSLQCCLQILWSSLYSASHNVHIKLSYRRWEVKIYQPKCLEAYLHWVGFEFKLSLSPQKLQTFG